MEFEVINSNNGLSSDDVRDIFQCSKGFLWLCTSDGLIRYDAYDFKIYKPNPKYGYNFSSKDFTCITEDKQGRLWIGTFNDGVNVFNPESEEIEVVQAIGKSSFHITHNHIRTVFCDSRGNIWIGTVRGLNKYNPITNEVQYFKSIELENKIIPLNNIHSVVEDAQGNIWFSAWGGYVCTYNVENGNLKAHRIRGTASSVPIRSMFIDSSETLWIGTWQSGLYRVDSIIDNALICKNIIYKELEENSLSGNIILSINEDVNNNIWVGTPYGLNIITSPHSNNPRIIRKQSNPNSKTNPSNKVIRSITRDGNNIMWLGTLGDGVNKVDFLKKKFDSYKIPEFNPQRKSQTVHAIIENKDGDLLIGVRSLGLVKYNRQNETFEYYKDNALFRKILNYRDDLNTAFCFMYDHLGFLWVGTRYGGLFRLDEQTGDVWNIDTVFNSANLIRTVNCLLEDSKKQIWIGTEDGLFKLSYNGGSEDSYDIELYANNPKDSTSISGNNIKALFEDNSGTLWIGTDEKGLNILLEDQEDHAKFGNFQTSSTKDNAITSNDICSIFQDSHDNLWIGTGGGGINLFDKANNSFVRFGENTEVIGDAIFDIIEDFDGQLWLGTNKGLVRFLPDNTTGEQFEIFTVEDGLESNILNKGAFYFTNDGFLYFGGHKGFNSFKPDDVAGNPKHPLIQVTEINVFNKTFVNLPGNGDKIEFNYKQYNFSIEFTGLSFSQPNKNIYAYKMEGFDTDWQYTTSANRKAYYANLRPGNYLFKLRAANSSGVWSENDYSLKVKIKPAPYFSWWAYTIYGVLSLVLLIIIYLFLLSQQKIKKDLEIEHIERIKSEKLNKFKLRFFTNISHELLTPLSILSAIVEDSQCGENITAHSVNILERNIARLVKLIHQLLVFRKIEAENLQLQVSRNDIAAFLRSLSSNFDPIISKNNITFTLDVPEKIEGYFDEDKIDKIVHNLLSNAFKYTPVGGSVTLRCNLNKEGNSNIIKIEIADSGRGIPSEKLGYIFDRFTRLEQQSNSGTGIGLELTKKLVELHNGEIGVESEVNVGTTFYFTIPINPGAYLKEQITESTINTKDYRHPEVVKLLSSEPELTQQPDFEPEVDDSKKKILVLEDNPDFRSVLKNTLSADYNVYQAENGKEGFEKAKKVVPDIVVSDVMMPVMDGLKFCKELKNTLEISHIPVILLTAKVNVESKTEGYGVGADSYIEKPVNVQMLRTRINALIQQREEFKALFKKELNLEPSKINIPSVDEKYFERVKEIVESNIDNSDFSVNKLVSEMGTSNSMLYRKISALTGMSPNEFIKSMRIKRAEQLIRQQKHSISEIAYITGFNNQSYFGVCFRKQFGMSPSEYIVKIKEESN